MPEKLADFSEEVLTGIEQDPSLPPDKVKFWIEGQDVMFREGGVQPFPAYKALASPISNFVIVGLAENRIEGERTLFWGTRDSLYKFISGGIVAIAGTGYNGILDETDTQIATTWSIEPWGTWIIATNGVDKIQIDQGAGFIDMDTLGDPPATAEIIVRHNEFLHAFNTDVDDREQKWADGNDIFTWAATASNKAGGLKYRDMSSPIIAAKELGDAIAVYGANELFLCRFINAPFWFGHDKVLEGIGAVSKHSVVQVGGLHYGFSSDGIFVTDGSGFRYIDDPVTHKFIFENINELQLSKVAGFYNRTIETVLFSWPGEGQTDNSEAIAYDTKSQVFSPLSTPFSVGIDGAVFGFPIVGANNGQIFESDPTGGTGGATLGSSLCLTGNATMIRGYGEGCYNEGGYSVYKFAG